MKESYETEMQKLSSMNDQVSQENSELVEKGKEATESLKVALHQLTEEKKAMQVQKRSSSGKEIREVEASLERAKKEREAFRQRCEKSEMHQRTLQERISSLKNELEMKEKELLRKSSKEDGGDVPCVGENSITDDVGESVHPAISRLSQLQKYVHILEDRIKEKDKNIVSVRKESARANDVAMEKSLELSRTRRVLERKIERLANENSELKRKFVGPTSNTNENDENKQGRQQQIMKGRQRHGDAVQRRRRRRSNPERWAVEGALKRSVDENSSPNKTNNTSTAISKLSGNQVEKPDDQDSGRNTFPSDVTPRRRVGGKFIRESSKRHSADLGKLMSRPEPVLSKRFER